MVFILHEIFRRLRILVVQALGFVGRQFNAFILCQFNLNQRNDGVIYNAEVLTTDIIAHFAHAFRLQCADSVGFDEHLIGDAGDAEQAPRSAVILKLSGEDVPADGYTCVVFGGGITHSSRMAQDTHFTLQCGYLELNLEQPVVMGILNITPDSFYDGGRYVVPEQAMMRSEEMLEQGAAILDLGAASSRPGAAQPTMEEEWSRLRPILEEVRGAFPSVLISIDTYRSEIAQHAADRGANIINDISGGMMDAKMFTTIAKNELAYVCMHMQGTPETMQLHPQYEDVVTEVNDFFAERTKALHNSGVENVILDPGFGFGKEVHHNYQLLKQLDRLTLFRKPLMVGVSRKSMITRLLDVSKDDALNGTTAVHMVALQKGARILRVHDVKEAAECIRIHGMIR